MNPQKLISIILGPLLFLVFIFFNNSSIIPTEALYMIGIILWMALWWATESVPIAITSLLPIILLPITNVLEISKVTESYGHKYIFLYLGGFIIAIAIEKWNLHKRIALNIISLIGTDISKIILGFMIATAFLSMFISNTATTVMMLPIAISVINQFDFSEKRKKRFGKALMLSIAYSASIGGIATLIGTPTNLVLAGFISETYNIQITFYQWIIFGFPISFFLLFICWTYLTNFIFKFKKSDTPFGKKAIKKQLFELGKINQEEKLVLIVFLMTGLLWITRPFFIQLFIPNVDDTIIAIFGAVILFILRSKRKNRPLLKWKEAVKIPWGILLLFGGGMALAKGIEISNLGLWIANQAKLLNGLNLIVLLIIIITVVNFFTEITSNVATIAMLLPILAPIAIGLNVHPYIFLVGASIASSCAFMLPVATPPNAVVFSSGLLKIIDMIKVGFILNIFSILIISIITFFILPILWDFQVNSIPDIFLIK
jgi:sodium-dependent dicarboxylate transporter 2/3/5